MCIGPLFVPATLATDGPAKLSTIEVVREYQIPPPTHIRRSGPKNAKRRAGASSRTRQAGGQSVTAITEQAVPLANVDATHDASRLMTTSLDEASASHLCCFLNKDRNPVCEEATVKIPRVTAFVLRLSIAIGRNRVVRRLLAAAGLPVFELRRVQFGPLHLRGPHGLGERKGDDESSRVNMTETASSFVAMDQTEAVGSLGASDGTLQKEANPLECAFLRLAAPGDIVRLNVMQEQLLRSSCDGDPATRIVVEPRALEGF